MSTVRTVSARLCSALRIPVVALFEARQEKVPAGTP